jgi:hypothetical protein
MNRKKKRIVLIFLTLNLEEENKNIMNRTYLYLLPSLPSFNFETQPLLSKEEE